MQKKIPLSHQEDFQDSALAGTVRFQVTSLSLANMFLNLYQISFVFGRRKKIKMPIERAACAYTPPTMQTQPVVPAALLQSPSVTGIPSLVLARDGHQAEDEMGQGANICPSQPLCLD